MRTFDACSDAGEHAFPVEVRVALATLSRRLGDVMLVGSWARDVCLVLDAWLDPGRMTDDLDVAVATSSLRELDERLGELGPRGGHGVRIYVEGVGVDVLPYGGLASDGIVQTSADSQLDVTCMAEAWRHADRLHVGDDVVIRTASLPLMVALKLVAWDVRSPGTDKDAQDFSRLLQATHQQGHYLDACYADPAGERFDWDPHQVGPFRVGRHLAEALEPGSRDRLVRVLGGDAEGDRLRAVSERFARGSAMRLDALLEGLTTIPS